MNPQRTSTTKPQTDGSRRFENAVHRFACALDAANRHGDILKQLLLRVGRFWPASRCELISTSGQVCARQNELSANAGNASDSGLGGAQMAPSATSWIEEVPLKWARADFGYLRVVGSGQDRPAQARQRARRLKTLCALAACALESLGPEHEWSGTASQASLLRNFPDGDSTTAAAVANCGGRYPSAVHDATFLNAILPFAIGQSQRHREPLSLVFVAVDRLHATRELLGRAAADGIARFVGEAIVSVVRASDIVARLDDDRVVAVLPRSGDRGAFRIGETIRQKVAESCWKFFDEPGIKITVSVGAATFPTSAEDVFSLFEAADAALAQAQAQGRNQTVMAPSTPKNRSPG
jgi:diguanylate cyclase (GGDEF)-like protein